MVAQDAGMVLRTSVGYGTQRASLPLTDEQKKLADQFGQEARQENSAGRYGEAMRRYHEGMAAMHSVAWTPQVELASSLTGHLDHAMLEPGKKVTISLAPLYPVDAAGAAKEKVNAAIFLVSARGGGRGGQGAGSGEAPKNLAAAVPIDASHLPFTEQITLPDVPTGDYTLEVRLTQADGSVPEGLRATFSKPLPIHVEALSADAAKLRDRLAKFSKSNAPTLATAQFVLARYEQTDKGDASPLNYNFRGEFATANAILDALDAGKDPLAGKHGDMRRAYLSKADQTLQPYRIFVPTQYDGSKATPLVVALHGMGGDENSMFDGYHEVMKVEAQRVGFLVVCPKGRDNASMYRGTAEQDVLDVLAEVRRDYKVDAKRIYLMGHSMGGYGTWSTAIDHPELFAALGPISGGGNAAGMEKIKDIPQYVVHGDDDRTVNVNQSRNMVAAGKKLNAPITYVEVPGGSHGGVAEPNFAPMLDFFVKQVKPTAAP
jgi:pimeloyl-ACP methyl ester carboxylesterase